MSYEMIDDEGLVKFYEEVCEELDDSEYGSLGYDSLNADLESIVREMDRRGMRKSFFSL